MSKEFSPEEKLLNLIKRKSRKDPGAKPAGAPAEAPEPGADAFFRAQKIPAPRPAGGPDPGVKLEHIRVVNMVLFSMLIFIILYILVDIFLIPPREVSVQQGELPASHGGVLESPEIEQYSYYSKNSMSKEIFKPLASNESQQPRPEIPIEELAGSLSLMGVVSGDTPQAIIEDAKQKKSYFLKEGQTAGGIFLKKIDDGAVTVIYKGEEFNLSL